MSLLMLFLACVAGRSATALEPMDAAVISAETTDAAYEQAAATATAAAVHAKPQP